MEELTPIFSAKTLIPLGFTLGLLGLIIAATALFTRLSLNNDMLSTRVTALELKTNDMSQDRMDVNGRLAAIESKLDMLIDKKLIVSN